MIPILRAPIDMPVVRMTQEAEPERHAKLQMDHDLRSNRLLGALEPASRKRIDPHLEPISFKLGDMVCEQRRAQPAASRARKPPMAGL